MARGPRLRVLGRHGAGTDNIDLEAARERGIEVVNTPRSNTDSVAEYVITVALMLLKRVAAVSERLVSGGFSLELGSLPGQVDRADAPQEHRDRCAQRVAVLKQQSDDLQKEVTDLLADVMAGRRQIKVYRQFKMYNDSVYRSQRDVSTK